MNNFEYLSKLTAKDSLILDVGCGANSPCQYIQGKRMIGLDGFLPYIIESRAKGIHDDYVLCDFNHIPIKIKSVDAIISLEVIEHFNIIPGHKLLKCLELLARKRIIISTPNGWLAQGEFDNNLNQRHRSGWHIINFYNRGYKVFGINGLKAFRGKIQLGNTNTPSNSKTTRKSSLMQYLAHLLSKAYYHAPCLASGLLAVKTFE